MDAIVTDKIMKAISASDASSEVKIELISKVVQIYLSQPTVKTEVAECDHDFITVGTHKTGYYGLCSKCRANTR